MAQQFLIHLPDELLPTSGTCPSCSMPLKWGELIKGAHFRHQLKTKGVVEDDNEDEFAELELDGQGSSTETMTITDSESSLSSDHDTGQCAEKEQTFTKEEQIS